MRKIRETSKTINIQASAFYLLCGVANSLLDILYSINILSTSKSQFVNAPNIHNI